MIRIPSRPFERSGFTIINYCIHNHPVHGKCLFVDNGIIEAGIPLEFGLRIGHFSFCGGKNVFFEQPKDMDTFSTEEGWRIRGGHRLWLAPESDLDDYFPDNHPIAYRIEEDAILLTQQEDPRLHVVKQFTLTFDGNQLHIKHRITNIGDTPLECALWAISVMAPGGTETIPLQRRDGGAAHCNRVSTWFYTDLGDPRVTYTRDQIVIRHQPLEQRYKIGIGRPSGPVCYENGGIVFAVDFPVMPEKLYPDGNVSYETFCSRYMVEMETLSPLKTIMPGETAEHPEIWTLTQ